VRTEINPRGDAIRMALRSYTRRTLVAFVLLVAGLCSSAGAVQAAVVPAPAWKLLALTGPTNLPPRQSEIQKVTVGAEGGTFTLSPTLAEGQGSRDYASGVGSTLEGSNQVSLFVVFEGAFKVGQTIVAGAIPAGTTITGIAGTASEPVLELSNNATESTFQTVEGASKEVTGVTTSAGQFAAGQSISGPGIAPGTTLSAVSGNTLTLSALPIGAGTGALRATATTAPIAYNAAAEALQSALEALPGAAAGSFEVSGGPGGDAEHPYFIDFGGPFVNRNVKELTADESALTGAYPFARVFTTLPGGPGTGEISVAPANIGGLATSGQYSFTLGPLPEGIVTSGPADSEGWSCPGGAGQSTVTCTSTEPVAATNLSVESVVTIPIEVQSNAAGAQPNRTPTRCRSWFLLSPLPPVPRLSGRAPLKPTAPPRLRPAPIPTAR
jgi:hypothetical protein